MKWHASAVKFGEVVYRLPSSGGECKWFGIHLVGVGVGNGGEWAMGEDFESDVTLGLEPLVGLCREDGSEEADDGIAVGEEPDSVGAAASEALGGVIGPDVSPYVFGERCEGQ